MIAGIARFAGWAATFAAGTLLPVPHAGAQATPRHLGVPGVPVIAPRSAVHGVVRDRGGRAQVGVAIELLNARYAVVARTFTDDRGRYSLPRLGAGLYQIKATSELLLPAIHPDLRLLANTRAVVNLTLISVYQALDWLPAERRLANSPADEWDWTLRLPTNRPLLRVLPAELARQAGLSGPVTIEHAAGARAAARASVAGGLRGFGEGGWSQQVAWRSAGEGGRALAWGVEAGQSRVGGTAALRQELAPDRTLTTLVSYTERPGIREGAERGLQIARVRSSSTVRAGELAELRAGTELAAARLGSTPVTVASHPFASLRVHSGGVQVEYRLATSFGADRQESDAAAEDAPALTAEGGRLRFAQGRHQELRATGRIGSWTGEIAGFEDRLAHPVVQGLVPGHAPGHALGDEAAIDSKDVLFDPETGIIAVSGRGYSHGGVMALLRDQLSPDTWFSLRFALGEAATAPPSGPSLPVFAARETPAAAIAAGTRLPGSGTLVRGSYRWQPLNTLTAVAPFAEAASDAYLGFSVRQPFPLRRASGEGATRVEALLDVRNLLAQGYRPFLSEDGSTVFFAQAQRTIAGGVSFSF